MPTKKLSIVMAAAECAPFAKVGGLGDVLGSLPQALTARGAMVSMLLPLYQSIDRKRFALKKQTSFTFERNGKQEEVLVWGSRLPKNKVRYYFLEHRLLSTASVYAFGSVVSSGIDPDIEKFSFYSEAVVEAAQHLSLSPDIIHCHDWHAGLVPTFVDQLAVTKRYPFTKTILTIHNLGNQGNAPRSALTKLNLELSEPAVIEDYYDLDEEHMNLLKIGILTADMVTTVSPTYAKEILTPEYGAGLESFLLRRKKHLYGIINGIDTKLFDPAKDTLITKKYTQKNWRGGKAVNKKSLQKKLGLPLSTASIYGLVSRLVTQKGLDILSASLEQFMKHDVQMVILGTGEKHIEQSLSELAKRFPKHISATIGFDLRLAQQIYAGSDFFLMPSRFEPCGLGQMIAMRYGTLPIVRATGGLKDTVQHMKTGIVFKDYSSEALSRALNQSLTLYSEAKKRNKMVDRATRQDFSWDASAKKYLQLYKTMTA